MYTSHSQLVSHEFFLRNGIYNVGNLIEIVDRIFCNARKVLVNLNKVSESVPIPLTEADRFVRFTNCDLTVAHNRRTSGYQAL